MSAAAGMARSLFMKSSPHAARVAAPAKALVGDSMSLYMNHGRTARVARVARAIGDQVLSGKPVSFATA